jgi:FKBP-type peptidyl-prolyl cis-trans isomerase FklB
LKKLLLRFLFFQKISNNNYYKMKKILLTFAAAFVFVSLNAQNLKNNMDSISYSLGVLFAQNFKNGEVADLDANALAQGFKDAAAGKETIKVEQANNIFTAFMQEAQKKVQEANKSKFAATVEEGKKFLAENGKRPTVKTTASGLQYEVMVQGTGVIPKSTDKVTTHYHGTLLNGKVFDSSVQRGQPIDFPVNGVIAGWTEALQLMPTGSKWKLFIPYNLAYGERGAGADIGPYATLIFEVELLKVN